MSVITLTNTTSITTLYTDLLSFFINKSESVSVCVSVCVCMYFEKKLYILLVSASLLRFLIIATTIETETFLWIVEHNVSLELLVGNSLNQGWPQESGNVLEDLTRIP
jgi:hypothetical protein